MGKPVITPAAQTALDAVGISGVLLLARHLHGDWGDLTEEDRLQNELALLPDLRRLSSYPLPQPERRQCTAEIQRLAAGRV